MKPEYLIPIVGDDYWSLEKMKEALLTLAVPCENIMGGLREEAQKDSSKYISDIAGMVDDISTLSDGTASVVEKLTKSVTAWSDVKIPDNISQAFTAAGLQQTWLRPLPRPDGMKTGGKAIGISWNICPRWRTISMRNIVRI